jgi:hypothetical protein
MASAKMKSGGGRKRNGGIVEAAKASAGEKGNEINGESEGNEK